MRLVELSVHQSCQWDLMAVVYTQSRCCQHGLGIQFLAELAVHLKKKKKTKEKSIRQLVTCSRTAVFHGWLVLNAWATSTTKLYFFLNSQFLQFIALHHFNSLLR